jgi:hypothetical protein
LLPDRLVERVHDDEGLKPFECLADATERKLSRDEVLRRREAELLETSNLGHHERLLGELGKDRAAPKRERRFEFVDGFLGVALEEPTTSLAKSMFEGAGIDRPRVRAESISVSVRKDQRPSVTGTLGTLEDASETGDVVLQHAIGCLWRIAPYEVDQSS